jgi:hypothetical protein
MSMHLEGPWLSTTGKKKGKKKFASADHARKARELKEQWEANKTKWDAMSPGFSKGLGTVKVTKKISPVVTTGPVIDPRRDTRQYSSVDTGGGTATKAAPKIYTGSKIVGIGTMHKSNMVPIFSNAEAEEISKMRRG